MNLEITMKNWSLAVLLASTLSSAAFADEAKTQPLNETIPIEEKAFVDAINKYDKASIIAQFGEPAKAEDVKIKGSGKVVATIWHYHKINKAEDGSYYPTTELDFIDDKVVQVVFLNHDGSPANDGAGKAYEAQPMPEVEILEEIPAITEDIPPSL
jgi:hypothetical protein